MTSATCMSFNLSGFSFRKKVFLENLMNTASFDFIFLQEHFLLGHNTQRLNFHKSYKACASSAHKETVRGRPKRGTAVLWNTKFDKHIDEIFQLDSRFCAVSLFNRQLIVVSAYFPVDSNRAHEVSDDFVEMVDDLSCFISKYQNSAFIIGTDANVDFSRNNAHSNYFLSFCEFNMLRPFQPNAPTFKSGSKIDHFVVRHVDCICPEVLSSPINPSDHNPIVTCVEIPFKVAAVVHSPKFVRSFCYSDSAKCTAFREDINEFVSRSSISCRLRNCRNKHHLRSLQTVFDSFVSHLVKSAHKHLSKKVRSGRRSINSWTPRAEYLKQRALWWRWLWKQNGSSNNSVVYQVMKSARSHYHSYINQLRMENSEKTAMSMCTLNSKKFWSRFKSLSGVPVKISPVINNKFGKDAADEFANDLLGCVSDAACDDSFVSFPESFVVDDSITSLDVQDAIRSLKSSSDDPDSVRADFLKLFDSCSISFISGLFNSFLSHEFTPSQFSYSILRPLFKSGKEDITLPKNYRLISSVSVFAKLYEYILLKKFSGCFDTDILQFGYKKNSSTNLAALTVKEIASHYLLKDSEVHACFLDASKAFDRVCFSALKKCLIDRQLPPRHLNLLMKMYYNQKSVVSWDGFESNEFSVKCGVRQGGVASAVLFSLYIDDLFKILRLCGVGCFVGSGFCGAIGYADDVALLSPTRSGLQKMIDITSSFLLSRSLKLNGAKSVYLVFQRKKLNVDINSVVVCGDTILQVDEVKYLGHIITASLSDKPDILKTKMNIVCTGYQIVQTLGGCSFESLLKVFGSKVTHLYGCTTWRLKESALKDLEVAWRKVLKCGSKLPMRTRTSLLHGITKSDTICDLIHERNESFLNKLSEHTNPLLVRLFQFGNDDIRSFIGSNMCACRTYEPKQYKNIDCHQAFEVWDILRNPFSNVTVPNFNKQELFCILRAMVT